MKYKYNKKVMYKVWIFCMTILLGFWNTSVFAEPRYYKPGSEPTGFRGIKWGTDISTLESMTYIETDPRYGGG